MKSGLFYFNKQKQNGRKISKYGLPALGTKSHILIFFSFKEWTILERKKKNKKTKNQPTNQQKNQSYVFSILKYLHEVLGDCESFLGILWAVNAAKDHDT